jgi:hypothetical protein
MSITHACSVIEADHGIVFLKTDDGEVHCLEFGEAHAAPAKHQPHDPTDGHIEKHSKAHEHHHEKKDDHAEHHSHEAYRVHVFSPIGSRPGTTSVPTAWTKCEVATLNVAELNHQLKHEWHHNTGDKLFHDAGSFVAHVMGDKLKAI